MRDGLLRSKTFACLEIVRNTARLVLEENKPTDRVVASYFKMNKKYGSKDRKFLYEIVFSFFRWLGWTRFLIKDMDSNSKLALSRITDRTLIQIFLASSLLDKLREKEIILYWIDELKINNVSLKDFESAEILKEKALLFSKLLRSFGIHKEMSSALLVPNWAYSKISSDAENDKFIEYCQTRPPIWLRLQTKDPSSLIKELDLNNVLYHRHDLIKDAVCIRDSEASLYNYDSFKKGLFEIQDIASQVIGIVASPKQGERWWDCCAGAGGKTLQLSTIMENKGKVIASDIREYKLDDLKKRARRDGRFNIECRVWDGSSLRRKKSESFDGVLVDSPCSCSGTWRRNPDAKWHTELSEIEELSKIQIQILENSSSAVKNGGVLVYATCSFLEEENICVVKKFLSEHPDFKLEPFANPIDCTQTEGYLQIYPWHADCDAMFVARMKKT